MTNWPKHLAEKHYFGVKHLSVESSLASHEKLQKAKFVGILESSLKSMSHEKSFEVQPKISGDSLISKCFDDGGTQFIIHRYENYTFKGSLRI